MDIVKLLIFFLFLSSPSANSNNLCPISYCPNNSLPITYPFKSQGNQTPNCRYTNLACTTQGAVILNLPNFGDFYVRDIHYGHGSPLILLYDPQNCLPRRIMGSNYTSFLPGVAAHFLYYTFYSCPPKNIAWTKFPTIGCLSNSSSAVVATRTVSREMMMDYYECKEIVTSSMPVAGHVPPDFIGDESDLALEWLSDSCESCPYWKREVVLPSVFDMAFIAISLATVIMPAIICIGCCISFITMFRKELKVQRSNANAPSSIAALP